MKRPRKIAVNRLLLPGGEILHQQVIEFDDHGHVVAYHPLSAEEPFTEWQGGDYRISDTACETPHK
jgi:hypothetical protein